MPESKFDRLFLGLGVCALAVLIAVILPAWREYASAGDPAGLESSPRTPAPTATGVADAASTTAKLTQPPEAAVTNPPARTPVAPHPAKLTLVAVGGDCWVEGRRGSASGQLLYVGILRQGERLTLSGRSLWLRLGAAENLTAQIGTKHIRDLPRGAATVVATPDGVRTLALG